MTRRLLPYQVRWVRDDAPGLVAIEKSRRIGLSWAEAYGCVMRAAEAATAGNVYYQSYAKEMTRGFIDDCSGWARYADKGASAVGETVLGETDDTVYRMEMSTGKEILAMTAAPRGFRSKGRPRDRAVIDEAAFVDDLDTVMAAAKGFLQWGGQIRVLSTHNGEANPFNRLCRAIEAGEIPGRLHKVTFADAVAEGLYARVCEQLGEEWTQEGQEEWVASVRAQYGEHAPQELDCVAESGAGRWLSLDLILRAEAAPAGVPELYRGGPVFVGVDVARRRDLFVIAVLELVGDVLWLRQMEMARDIEFVEQDALLDEIVGRYRPLRVAADQTGMGEKPVEDMKRRYGELRVEGVLMTGPRRLDVATVLRTRFEKDRLRIPRDDDLRRDLRSVRTEDGPGGAPRLLVPRTKDEDGAKTHADRFWAIALACAAAEGAGAEYGYQAVAAARTARTEEPSAGDGGWLRPDHSDDDRRAAAGAW